MRKLSYWVTFNFVVGVTGVVSIAIMEYIGARIVQPGEDFVEPLAMLAGVLFFGLASNVALVAGVARLDNQRFEQRFWRVLKWCSGLATAPIWLAVMAVVLRR